MKKFGIGDFLSDGFRFSTKPYSRAVILGVLFLLSFLIVPVFLVLGYVYRCIRRSLEGEDSLPEYGEWGRMFVDGVKLFVAYLILLIPAALVSFAVSRGSIGLGVILNPFAIISVMAAALTVSFVIALIVNIYLFMAIPYVVYTDKISSVLEYREIFDRIKRFGTGRYIAVVIVTMIMAWILNLIGGLIPVIGVILISPIALLLLTRVQAMVFKETST